MMRYRAFAAFACPALLAAIIAAFPAARVHAQTIAAAPSAATGAMPSDAPASRPTETASATPPRMVASLSHDLQFGLALLMGDGYRGIFPYDKDIACGDAKSNDNRVCTNRAPAFLDLQPSFGLSDRWDFLADLRFGLTKDFNTYHQFYVMPGFRYWLDPQSQVKFFSTLQLAYDRSKQNNPPNAPHVISDNDLGFRNSNGLMVEVMRNFGVYFQFGETVGFYRWLSFMADAGIGVQARVP
jgi:hypothetical protein